MSKFNLNVAVESRQQKWKWEAEQLSLAALGGFLLPKLIQLLQRSSDVLWVFGRLQHRAYLHIGLADAPLCQTVHRLAYIFTKCCDAYTVVTHMLL